MNYIFIFLIFLSLLLILLAYIINQNTESDPSTIKNIRKQSDFIEDSLKNEIINKIIDSHYLQPKYDDVEKGIIFYDDINKYLSSLDPYSQYISYEKVEFIEKRSAYKRVGIGIDILIDGEKLLIYPFQNSPASLAGLDTAQYLKKINNNIINPDIFSSYKFIGDLKKGDSYKLITKNNKKYILTVDKYNNIGRSLTYKNYTIITVRNFDMNINTIIKESLNLLAKDSKLIIDLRYSTGGDIFKTMNAISFFLSEKIHIAYLHKKHSKYSIPLKNLRSLKRYKKRIYILTSQFTASSAEVFVRALKTLPKVKVIGEKTKGKCLAQKTVSLTNGANMLISSYEILDKNMKSCEGIPILPHKYIKNIELMKLQDIIPFL